MFHSLQNITISKTSAAALGLGLALAASALPAHATGVGVSESCANVNPNRWQCTFSPLSTTGNVIIQYASMQCGSTGTVSFSLQEFQVLATPPGGSSELSYQVAIANQPSVDGVVSTGSPVTIYVKNGTSVSSLIDLAPAPNGTNQCSVSLSAN